VVGDRIIGLSAMKDPSVEQPGPDEVYQIGTAALIHRLLKAPDGSVRLIVQGMERFEIESWVSETPYLRAFVHLRPDILEETVEVEALARNLTDLFRRLITLVPHLPDELMMAAMNADDPRHLTYLIATSIRMDIPDAQDILELDHITDKLRKLTTILNKELEVLELGRKIQNEAQSEMENMQREYFLREQLKAIQKELGEGDESSQVVQEYREKIEAAGMTEEAAKEALRELGRMEKIAAPGRRVLGDQDVPGLADRTSLAGHNRRQPGYSPCTQGPRRGPLRPGRDQRAHPGVPGRAQAAPGTAPPNQKQKRPKRKGTAICGTRN